MPSLTINLTYDEYDLISSQSKKLGMSPHSYLKHLAFVQISPRKTHSLIDLIHEADQTLEHIEPGEPFMAASLIKEWPSLTRSEKSQVIAHVSKIIKSNPDKYDVLPEKFKGKTNRYIKC